MNKLKIIGKALRAIGYPRRPGDKRGNGCIIGILPKIFGLIYNSIWYNLQV